MLIMSEPLHCTPCHASAQGSPPEATHPGSKGEPNAAYKLLIAATNMSKAMQTIRYVAPHDKKKAS